MTELRTTASNAIFDDTIAQLGAQNPQQAIEVLDRRQDLNEQSDRYFAAPIIGVFDNDFPVNPGDRYIDSADPTVVKVVGGTDEPFPDGAIARFWGTNEEAVRIGQNIEVFKFKKQFSTSTLVIYISNTGDDANTGVETTSPVATFDRVWEIAQQYDLLGKKIQVYLLSDLAIDYSILIDNDFGADSIELFSRRKVITWTTAVGVGIEVTTTFVKPKSYKYLNVAINEVYFNSTNPGNINLAYISAYSKANLTLDKLVFLGNIDGVNIESFENSNISQVGNVTFKNSSSIGILLDTHSRYTASNSILFDGASFEEANIACRNNSHFHANLIANPSSSPGIASGKRFELKKNSSITLGKNGDLLAIPGTLPGTAEPGCNYDGYVYLDDTIADLVEGVTEASLQTVIEKIDSRLDAARILLNTDKTYYVNKEDAAPNS